MVCWVPFLLQSFQFCKGIIIRVVFLKYKKIRKLLDEFPNLYAIVDDTIGGSWVGKNGKGYVMDSSKNHPKLLGIVHFPVEGNWYWESPLIRYSSLCRRVCYPMPRNL